MEYIGKHHGYERLPEPVTHERTFRFHRESGDLVIVDRLDGRGRHDVAWHFHFAPGVQARADGGRVLLTAAGRTWTLTLPAETTVAILAADYSPSYGVKIPCLAIDASARIELAGERAWEIAFRS